MTRYTDGFKSIIICDQCRTDIQTDENVITITPGKAKAGYTIRDFDKGEETVLCLECANKISQILAIMGIRYADSLTLREAA